MVAALGFEILQEPDDALEAEVGEGQARDPASLVGRDELEKQPDGVPVAADRGRAQALDRDQVIDEERVQDRPERLGAAQSLASTHAGSANASNRRFAWFSSPGVMVR